MASNDIQLCDICNLQHLTSEAIEWCAECDEHLCKKCKVHHALSKSTRKHETVTIENVMKLPQFVRESKINCSEHDERFVYFCNKHDTLCCIECLHVSHNECRNLSLVQKVVRDVKSSSSFSDLENTVSDTITNIDNIMVDRTDNLNSLNDDKAKFLKDLQETRQAYNMLMDKLEADLTNEMEQNHSEKQNDIKKLLAELGIRKKYISDIQENIDIIKKHASDFQSFLAMQELIKVVHNEENKVEQLFEGDSMKWCSISMKPTHCQIKEEDVPALGSVDVKLHAPKVSLQVRKIQEAQFFENALAVRDVVDIELKEKARATIKTQSIMDCCILSNGNLLFSDKDKNRCVLLDNDGRFVKNMNLSFSPIGITLLADNQVAVTADGQLSITIVDLDTCEIVKTIPIETKGGSISFENEILIVHNLKNAYQMLDASTGEKCSEIPVPCSNLLLNVCTCVNGDLFHVNGKAEKIYCRDFTGNLKWEFLQDELQLPHGITSDNSNILFVTGFKSKNVVAVSTDGTSYKEVIKPTDELASVICAHYSITRKELLVCTQNGNVFLYEDT